MVSTKAKKKSDKSSKSSKGTKSAKATKATKAAKGDDVASALRTPDAAGGGKRVTDVIRSRGEKAAPASTTSSPSLRKPSSNSVRDALRFVSAYNNALGLKSATLVEKHQVMSADAHAFYRAMPALFYTDLKSTFAEHARLTDKKAAPKAPILVDFHLGNLGTFRGPKGAAVWGPNDYDQAGMGSPEIDLLRASGSVALLLASGGWSDEVERGVRKLVRSYDKELTRIAQGGKSPGPFLEKAEATGAIKTLLAAVDERRHKALLAKHTDGKSAFLRGPRLTSVPATEAAAVMDAMKHAGFVPLNVVSRLHSGGSSRGLQRYWVLVEDAKGDKVRLRILEAKIAPPSPLHDVTGKKPFDAHGLIKLQSTMMGAALSPYARAIEIGGRAYLVREVEVEKESLDLKKLKKGDVIELAEAAGTVLARTHASSAGLAGQIHAWLKDEVETAVSRLQRFALDYSQHVVAQHGAFAAAAEA